MPGSRVDITRTAIKTGVRAGLRFAAAFAALILSCSSDMAAQSLTQRGFVEARGTLFPQDAPNDRQNLVGDLRAREEVFFKPAKWVQFAGGVDALVNTHDAWAADARRREAVHPLGQGRHHHADRPIRAARLHERHRQ